MKNILLLFLIQVCFTCLLSAQDERELTIIEYGSDDDAVLKIHGEDTSATDYMNLELGFNRGNQGWLRMRTNHDLGFFTNDKRRMSIRSNGVVDVSNLLVVGSLAGDGFSTVRVDQNGILQRQLGYPIQKMVLAPTNFYGTALIVRPANAGYMYSNTANVQSAMINPVVPYSKYKILGLEFHFTDADGANFSFILDKYDQDYGRERIEILEPNVGSANAEIENMKIRTISNDVTIDQALGEHPRIRIIFPGVDIGPKENMRIWKVIMTYQQVD